MIKLILSILVFYFVIRGLSKLSGKPLDWLWIKLQPFGSFFRAIIYGFTIILVIAIGLIVIAFINELIWR